MGKKPKRKLFKHVKRHKLTPKNVVTPLRSDHDYCRTPGASVPLSTPCEDISMRDCNSENDEAVPYALGIPDSIADDEASCNTPDNNSIHLEVGTISRDVSACNFKTPANGIHQEVQMTTKELQSDSEDEDESISDLFKKVNDGLLLFLPANWMPIIDRDGIHVVLMSRQKVMAVQRDLFFSVDGSAELSVHTVPVDISPFTPKSKTKVSLSSQTIGEFIDNIVYTVNSVRQQEVCAGFDNTMYRSVWNEIADAEIDKNPYKECRYMETVRSLTCARLVSSTKWKCAECIKLGPRLRRKYAGSIKENVNKFTNNINLSQKQTLQKLKDQQKEIDKRRKQVEYLQNRMAFLIRTEGINLEKDISEKFMDLIQSIDLTPVQSMFLQQQVKASQKKNMSGMRWHPSMIRVALAIHTTSPAAYRLLKESGIVSFPSVSTLFDYSHADAVKEGIDEVVIKSIAENLDKLINKKGKNYQRYHVLMADEMFISKSLVFHKTTGKLVGFMTLNSLDAEIETLEKYLNNPEKNTDDENNLVQANKMMTFLVKGVANDVKEVVASYAVKNISAKQMYAWTWDVIGALERSGIWVISFTGDASSTNRAFFKLHVPATTNSDVVFDTVNIHAPHRNLYFFSDVPHLLKTIRNCFNNSRLNKKGKRCLIKNGEKIVWNTIVTLYNRKKGKFLRKAYKLNAQNVFPDSYSCMKVSLAAQVLSRTVATDIEQEKLPGTSETVKFIKFVDDWFDCMNGAHSTQGMRTKNVRLNPYKSTDDSRFCFLDSFVAYLDEWKEEAEQAGDKTNDTAASSTSTVNATADIVQELCPVEDVDEVEDTPAAKRQLSHQTILGVKMSVNAFKGAVKFLLSEGTKFINARIFCQDPIEQYFSKQRSGGGGCTNPNVPKFLHRQRAIHTLRKTGFGVKRKGNSGEVEERFEILSEKLRKRRRLFSLDLCE